MKCRAWVDRKYSQPGFCENKHGLKFIRWAPTPLKTFAGVLCRPHQTLIERGGKVLFAEPKAATVR